MIATSDERYRILEELGQGGMSVVYRGLDTALEREVAVKMLHGHLASKPENRMRFHREAKAIARLRHPNILEVYDYSSADAEKSYIVMEYIPGANLRQFLQRRGVPPAEVCAAMGAVICQALEHAHEQGVIHRDIKPENVMVSTDGAIKLMDFGIAYVMGAETMTQTGSLLGSPAHMPPELIDDRTIDVRSDIFSFGTVLYWMATGRLPFDGQNAPQVLKRVLDGHFEDPDALDPRIGHELAAIIARCMAPEPDDRYPDVASLRAALEAFVRAAGYDDPGELLARYFKNPEGFTLSFGDVIVPRLTERGRRAMAQGQVARASQFFNRVLAYDPLNEDVRGFLDAMSRRRTMRQGAVVLASVAACAALVWWMVASSPVSLDPAIEGVNDATALAREAATASQARRHVHAATIAAHGEVARHTGRAAAAERARQVEARARGVAEAQNPRLQVIANVVRPIRPLLRVKRSVVAEAVAPATDPAAAAPGTSAPETSGTATGSAAARTPRVTTRFTVSPPAATLYVDGRALSAMEAARGIDLEPGRHVVTARSPGCKPFRTQIVVRAERPERVPIVLDWEDGFVHVVTNQDALVWLNGQARPFPVYAGGQSAPLRVPFGAADTAASEQKVQLRVAARHDLQQSRTQVVTVRPGNHATVNINFASP